MSQRVRVHLFSVSRDGYGSGEGQSLDHPFGHIDPGVFHDWAFSTAFLAGDPEKPGSRGLDDYIVRDYSRNIGAEIMGRNKFSPYRGPGESESWQGWWGDDPPFHTPVFVLTHFPRTSITLSDTTFHFLNSTPEEALLMAKAAANGKDIRIGGGVATIRQFLEADLIDEMHIAVIPFDAGRGERFWNGPGDLYDRYHHEKVASLSGVTHHFFWRRV